MQRPTDKFLKEMSNDELRAESEWHISKAESLLAEVREMRLTALGCSAEESMEILSRASAIEADAEAHRHQSLVLQMACKPGDEATPIKQAIAGSKV